MEEPFSVTNAQALANSDSWPGLLAYCMSFKDDSSKTYDYWYYLGVCYSQIKMPSEAIDAYKRALHLNPSDPRIWDNMGALYTELGMYSEAETFINSSLKLNPNLPNSWYNLGTCYGLQGKHSKAEDAFTTAISLRAYDRDTYISLIQALLSQGKYGKAYNTAVALGKYEPDVAKKIMAAHVFRPNSMFTPYELPEGLRSMHDAQRYGHRIPPGWWRLDDGTEVHVEPEHPPMSNEELNQMMSPSAPNRSGCLSMIVAFLFLGMVYLIYKV